MISMLGYRHERITPSCCCEYERVKNIVPGNILPVVTLDRFLIDTIHVIKNVSEHFAPFRAASLGLF